MLHVVTVPLEDLTVVLEYLGSLFCMKFCLDFKREGREAVTSYPNIPNYQSLPTRCASIYYFLTRELHTLIIRFESFGQGSM